MQRRPLPGAAPSEAIAIARDLWRRGRVAVRRTPGLLLLSLLIGGALWVFVTDVENPGRVDLFPAFVPVEAVNVGQALAVANTLPAVQLRVSAPEDRWERLTSANFRAFVDLNGLDAREQKVAVNVHVEGIGGVRVVETIPGSVLVNLEDFVRKPVPVLARLVGTVPLGYEVMAARLETETVEVYGPESLVDLVREAVAEVNVTGLTLGLEQAVNLTPRGAGGGEIRGVRLDPPSLEVALSVAHTTLTLTLPLTAVIDGQPASGHGVSGVAVYPPTASVQGTIEVLQGLEALTLAAVDIEGSGEGEVRRLVALQLPEGVRAPDQSSATVVVTVEPVEGSLRLSVAPEAVRVPEGLVARFDDETVTVVLRGPLPVLNALTAGDVRAIVDAAGLEAATVELTLEQRVEQTVELTVDVQAPQGVRVVTVQPQVLSVTLGARR